MTTTTAPRVSINSSANDYFTSSGVRISIPLYIDLTGAQRKELLNAAREVASRTTTSSVKSQSGISVETTTGGLTALEAFIGCSFDILRQSLFSRGGVSADLVLRLQAVTGVECVSQKDIETAFKNKAGFVKSFMSSEKFDA